MAMVYSVLCTVYYVLCIMYCVLCTIYCVLCIIYCVLCTVYCVLCTVYLWQYLVLCWCERQTGGTDGAGELQPAVQSDHGQVGAREGSTQVPGWVDVNLDGLLPYNEGTVLPHLRDGVHTKVDVVVLRLPSVTTLRELTIYIKCLEISIQRLPPSFSHI